MTRKPFVNMKKKLAQTAGDTMAEVLVAILISALAAMLLASMVMASTNMIRGNTQALEDVHTAESTIAAASKQGTGIVTISGGGMGDTAVTVDLFSSDPFLRYEPLPLTGTGGA